MTSEPSSLDMEFVTNALNASWPGLQLFVANLTLRNTLLEVNPFLQLSAFRGVTQRLSNLSIVSDCNTLAALMAAAKSFGLQDSVHPGFLYVTSYASSAVQVSGVNITCEPPEFIQTDGVLYTLATSGLDLLNALVADQLSPDYNRTGGTTQAAPLVITLTRDISLSSGAWRPSLPLHISRNITIRGSPSTPVVLDLRGLYDMAKLQPSVGLRIEFVTLMNLSPLRKLGIEGSILPMFSLPVWFFTFVRDIDHPPITMTNVTLVVPPSEFSFFTIWTLVFASNYSTDYKEQLSMLRATTPVILAYYSTSSSHYFKQLKGTGLDMYNLTITLTTPPAAFQNVVLDNPYLRVDNLPNVYDTHVPVYDLSELVAALSYLHAYPNTNRVVTYLLTNITVDPNAWPSDGFSFTNPLTLLGLQAARPDQPSWLNFRRTANFVRSTGSACTANQLNVTGLQLLNLPNALASTPRTAAEAAALAALQKAAAKAGLDDISVLLSGLSSSSCPGPIVTLRSAGVVVTYQELKVLRAMVSRILGNAKSGQGTFLNSNLTFTLSNVVADYISFTSVQGWTWNGDDTTLTYEFPPGVPVLYNNTMDPPPIFEFVPPAPPPPPSVSASASASDHKLDGWQVALIVVGSVVFVALLTALIVWRVVSRTRRDVETVRSTVSDKKSSTASGEGEGANGGVRLGSSGAAGNGSHAGNGSGQPGSPLAHKGGSQGGGMGGGGAGGGGTSDDSTGVQFDRPPLEVLNSMMVALTAEMDDRHLTILEVIGQGGFGVVYRGMWKGLNVAVKTITFQDRVAGGEKAQHRAILEAAISSSLAHPNVVTTYSYDIKPLTVQGNGDADSTGSGPHAVGNGGGTGTPGGGGGFKIIDKRHVLDWKLYLIQEYCDGGSLRTAILKRKFFDAKKGEPRMEMILDTCIELTGGLVHLHERNIIHGDLNPNNVLLKRDANKKYGAICKIADFGLSIKMGADQSHISNMRRGTPFYTCPQILARGNMTRAADVYSMGVMMWEMYHCCMSYRSLPSGFQARESFPHFPRKAPSEFARLVGSCLAPEPADRPTFAQLRTGLESQLALLRRGELGSLEDVLGPDPAGDAAHLTACQDQP